MMVDCPDGGRCGYRKHDPTSEAYRSCFKASADKSLHSSSTLTATPPPSSPLSASEHSVRATEVIRNIPVNEGVVFAPEEADLVDPKNLVGSVSVYRLGDGELEVSTDFFVPLSAFVPEGEDPQEYSNGHINRITQFFYENASDRSLETIEPTEGLLHSRVVFEVSGDATSDDIFDRSSEHIASVNEMLDGDKIKNFRARLARQDEYCKISAEHALMANAWSVTGDPNREFEEESQKEVGQAFLEFYDEAVSEGLISDTDPDQLGHDFMLSAMGTGVGFSDRANLYGENRYRLDEIARKYESRVYELEPIDIEEAW